MVKDNVWSEVIENVSNSSMRYSDAVLHTFGYRMTKTERKIRTDSGCVETTASYGKRRGIVPLVIGVEPLLFTGVDRAITIAEVFGSREASMTCTGCRPGRARGRRWAAMVGLSGVAAV